ncbi:MAG: TetR family transcriptional regulator [Spirochaetia bacterium]|nr:TetR family transcriptional regulator [Spirochaetia bacterium]
MARSRTESKADRRDQIMAAALRLFSKQGYAATPVPLIAGELGVAVGGLYRYFPSKELLANAVYQRAMKLCSEFLLSEFRASSSIQERFHHLWQRMHKFAVEYSDEFVFLELHNHDTYLNKKSLSADAELTAVLDAYIKEGQKAGEIRKMEPALAISIVLHVYLAYFRSSTGGEIKNLHAGLAQAERAAWLAIST